MPKRILVTGSAGFIGSNFVKMLLGKTEYPCLKPEIIVSVDSLTYASQIENIQELISQDHRFYKQDIKSSAVIEYLIQTHEIDCIVNFAAESHVDNSIADASPFLQTNVVGTFALLELAKKYNLRYVQVSTDEVYGSLSLEEPAFTENNPLKPNSPYAASKAAADCFVRSYIETFKLNAVITRCSNNYGPHQHKEKLIPKIISNALNNQSIPIYGNGQNVRDWIYVLDHCYGIYLAMLDGNPGEVFNFGASTELTNLQVAETVLDLIEKPKSLISYVDDRLGHDFRYAINSEKADRLLGWWPRVSFEDGIKSTIEYYKGLAK